MNVSFQIAMCLVIAGALNWLFMCMNINVVESIFGSFSYLIYALIGLSAISIMFHRDTYLPFLGPTVVPCSILTVREPPGANKEMKIIVTPNTKILYWAAEPKNEKLKKIVSWKEAYDSYENTGVTISNGGGEAILKVRSPQSYKVPIKGELPSHIHYRVCGESGWLGHVQTVYLKEPDAFEPFSNFVMI